VITLDTRRRWFATWTRDHRIGATGLVIAFLALIATVYYGQKGAPAGIAPPPQVTTGPTTSTATATRTSVPHPTSSTAPAPAPAAAVLNTFRIKVQPGWGYDLDIPQGQDPYQNADWHNKTPDPRDIYRTSKTSPDDHISGTSADGRYNPVRLLAPSDGPPVCVSLRDELGGNVKLSDIHVGDRICVGTHQGHSAIMTVVQMPRDRLSVLVVDVTLLA
jgi:hypothetical protein